MYALNTVNRQKNEMDPLCMYSSGIIAKHGAVNVKRSCDACFVDSV